MLVYGKYECFVMQMLLVYVLCASFGISQCCIMYDLQFVNAGRGCKRRPYGRGKLRVLYVSFGSKVRSRTFGCLAMCSVLLFIFRSRLLLYSAGSGVNRVQVVLSGFSVRLFCFVQAKTLCRYGYMYPLPGIPVWAGI